MSMLQLLHKQAVIQRYNHHKLRVMLYTTGYYHNDFATSVSHFIDYDSLL